MAHTCKRLLVEVNKASVLAQDFGHDLQAERVNNYLKVYEVLQARLDIILTFPSSDVFVLSYLRGAQE